MKSARSPLVKVSTKAPTGIAGFDEITGGGLPRGRTDVVLAGGMNGGALVERVRAQWPSLRVLFASGYTSDVTILQGLVARGVALAHKPFTAESLGEKVREVLDRRE